MFNAELTAGVATYPADAEAQFQNPVFQTRRLDEQSGHNFSETL
jgi:hypothetical protein